MMSVADFCEAGLTGLVRGDTGFNVLSKWCLCEGK